MTKHNNDPGPPLVLVFSASDPTGGAGMQADVLTMAGMGCHALGVITALTVQDTAGVKEMLVVDTDYVVEQARTVLEDMPVRVFKLGVLGSGATAAAIAEIISDYPHIPVVVDPVLASGRGDPLAGEDLLEVMRELILPLSTVLTPNSMEARRLVQFVGEESDGLTLDDCARRLIRMGCEYVLVTGSHENTPQVLNTLYGASGVVRTDAWERLAGSYHGSGCTLASAIAGALAHGADVPRAVREAQNYTWHTLDAAFRPGMGQHIPDRFFWARPGIDRDH